MRVLKWLSFCLFFVPVLAASGAGIVHSYRYQMVLRSGELQYGGRISGAALTLGPRYDVETDKRGRQQSVTDYEYGKQTGKTVYHYDGDSQLPDREDYYTNGKLNGTEKITRDEQGNRVKEEDFTAAGELTEYWERSYLEDHMHLTAYDKDGNVKKNSDLYFAANGVHIRTILNFGTTKGENVLDPKNGELTAQTRWDDGKLTYRRTYTYDANAELLRSDSYNPDGSWFASDEYNAGLYVTRRATLTDGTKEETRISYDADENLKSAQFTVNGNLVCTFQYDLYPDGTIKRTLALGPSGEVYGEYPNIAIYQVNRDGSPAVPVDNPVIHKTGDWW